MFLGKITRHEAGEFVDGGIYLSRKSWDLTAIPEEGGRLPAENGHYYRLPLLMVMALAPIAGLAFILFSIAMPVMVICWCPAPSPPQSAADRYVRPADTP
jgi:hypothetical protein